MTTAKLCGLVTSVALGLLLIGCNDELSTIGEVVQPQVDQVESSIHHLQFEARSVAQGGVYSSTPSALLGEIADLEYGNFRGEFVTQVRSARGFAFKHTPIGGQIDSVQLMMNYRRFVGNPSSPLKVVVYEAPRGFAGQSMSSSSLEEYRDPDMRLGERELVLSRDTRHVRLSQVDSLSYLTIPLSTELGERIYNLSKSNPDYFASQTSFGNQVLGGLLVTSTTGSGVVFMVQSMQLAIFYTYKDDKGEDKVGVETFINTRQTPQANGLENSGVEQLLAPNATHTYIKSPAGVVTELTLSRAQMLRLLEGEDAVRIGENWTLADAQLNMEVDNPTELLLNPPAYMMLLPRDSVESFFRSGDTERSRLGQAYLSSRYSIESRHYNFSNISRLITNHLKAHARYNQVTKSWSVAEDLMLRIVPVDRLSSGSGDNLTTTAINEYLFPGLVRLSKAPEKLKVGVVSTEFKR